MEAHELTELIDNINSGVDSIIKERNELKNKLYSILDKVRALMDAHDAMTKKPTLLTIADYEEIRHAVREALAGIDRIKGGIDETDKR